MIRRVLNALDATARVSGAFRKQPIDRMTKIDRRPTRRVAKRVHETG